MVQVQLQNPIFKRFMGCQIQRGVAYTLWQRSSYASSFFGVILFLPLKAAMYAAYPELFPNGLIRLQPVLITFQIIQWLR